MGFFVPLASPKVLPFDKMQENVFSFVFVLTYSYLCDLIRDRSRMSNIDIYKEYIQDSIINRLERLMGNDVGDDVNRCHGDRRVTS